MAAGSATRHKPRSISLPTLRSNSKTQRAEQDQFINKLKSLESAPSKIQGICNSLFTLVELYASVDDLINTPEALLAFSNKHYRKWAEEWLEESVVYLDLCNTTREAISTLKGSFCEIQSTLRRSKGSDLSCGLEADHNIVAHLCSPNTAKKEMKKCLSTLKRMESEISDVKLDDHRRLTDVVRVLQEARKSSITVFRSTLTCLFEEPSNVSNLQQIRGRKWPLLLSKLVTLEKRRSGAEDGSNYCKQSAGSATDHHNHQLDVTIGSCLALLQKLMSRRDEGEEESANNIAAHRRYAEMMTRCLIERLKALENSMECVEKKMEGLFRCLIQTRVSFLNVLSC